MQSEKAIRKELNRYPDLMKRQWKEQNIGGLIETYFAKWTLEWVLSDDK